MNKTPIPIPVPNTTPILLAVAAFLALTPASLHAGTDTMKPADTKDIVAPAPECAFGSKITGLLQVDAGDKYYTPRGLESSKNGISFQPLLILFLELHKSDTGVLTDLSLYGGVWNDIDTGQNGKPAAFGGHPGNWDEIDGFVGLEAKLFHDWKFDAQETFFRSQTDSYDTTTNFDFKATYLDHWFGKTGFSINPYVEGFDETTKKATFAFNAATDKGGFYFVAGMDPTYKFSTIPLTLELPTAVNYVSEDFYQRANGTPGGTGFAVYSTELKGTVPLDFIPKCYGAWSVYAGVLYDHLDNPGLEDGNQALGGNLGDPSKRDTNIYKLHCGVTCFF